MRVLIRGAGDLATGVAWELYQRGHTILMTERNDPLTVRRLVSFSRAVYEGSAETDGVQAVRAASGAEAEAILADGSIPVIVDEQAAVRQVFRPDVLVDAIMAKRNLGTQQSDAPLVIALGPGFTAGTDCDAVIETQRGEHLGEPIWNGSAAPDTGIPGDIGGCTTERLLRAQADGRMEPRAAIGETVEKGQIVALTGGQPVRAQIRGVIRGLLQEGAEVTSGLKIGDVDPRNKAEYCYHISDKAHRIGEGVAAAIETFAARR